MADGRCPNCGTEIEADARFCPTCGNVLKEEAGQPEIPPAPAWPGPASEPGERGPEAQAADMTGVAEPPPTPAAAEPPEPDASKPEASASDETERDHPEQLSLAADEPEKPGSDARSAPPAPAPGTASAPARGPIEPFTWPTTLSGWLIGIGSLVGAVTLLPSLADAVSLILFLALLGVGSTVFLADRLPEVRHLRLLILSTGMVGLGIAFERSGFGARGVDSILLVAMIAVAGGALLVELDRDRPVPPPGR